VSIVPQIGKRGICPLFRKCKIFILPQFRSKILFSHCSANEKCYFTTIPQQNFDGTFASCLKLFKQVFIIFGIHKSDHLHVFPAFIFLLKVFE
jgi:hypothetical protein